MSQNEIMAQIKRIPRPRDKMVDISAFTQFPFAVEAMVGLDIFEDCAKTRKNSALGAEEEIRQVRFTEEIDVESSDMPNPSGLNQVANQVVKFPEAINHAQIEINGIA